MIIGIGFDTVEIPRFQKAIHENPLLLDKIFTSLEKSKSSESLAGKFAAKEALVKALNLSRRISWQEIEIDHEENGRPFFKMHSNLELSYIESRIWLSITHTSRYASAVVIIEKAAQKY